MPSDAPALRVALAEPVRAVPRPSPAYTFALAVVDNYSALLSGATANEDVDVARLAREAREGGRLLLCAEAGAGKSTVALETLLAAADDGAAIARIDLLRWTPEFHADWTRPGQASVRRMRMLLDRAADAPTDEAELRRASGDAGALVVVDGLNEIPSSTTGEVLSVLDDFAARSPWAGVLVCDRLTRRTLPSPHWRLATILAVTRPDGEGASNALLLDLSPEPRRGEARPLLSRLSDTAGGEAMPALADAALALYADYRGGQGRYFERSRLEAPVGDSVVAALENDGLLLTEGERSYFRHHLFHDVLAASAVARDRSAWDRRRLDDLTFGANSFDAIGLALELLGPEDDADEFVMAVYDWNLYAVAAGVAHARRHRAEGVSEDIELALLGVLAERRWDPVAGSAQRVEDALRVSPHLLAAPLLAADDREQVVELVRDWADEHALGVGRAQWLRIFSGDADEAELLEALHGGPIPGWVASNVLRRRPLGQNVRDHLLDLLGDDDPTVRWRAVHSLGADAGPDGARGLLGVLDADADLLVRYGAVRAIVETAAGDAGLREWLLAKLQTRLDVLRQDRVVFDELQRALELRDPPEGWAGEVAPLIEQLFLTARSVEDQDHWLRVGRRITESVQRARVSA